MKKSNTSERLKQLLKDRNIRQADILEKAKPYCEKFNIRLGRNDLSQYVSGKVVPGQDKLTILGLALNVSETWLMGYDVPMEREVKKASKLSNPTNADVERYFQKTVKDRGTDHFISEEELQEIEDALRKTEYITQIPVLKSVGKGSLNLSPDNVLEYIDISNDTASNYFWGTSFAICAKDNSLKNLGIEKGDTMFFDTENDLDPHDTKGQIVLVSTDIVPEPFIRRLTLQHDGLVILDAKGDALPMAFSYSDFIREVEILGRLVCNVKLYA